MTTSTASTVKAPWIAAPPTSAVPASTAGPRFGALRKGLGYLWDGVLLIGAVYLAVLTLLAVGTAVSFVLRTLIDLF